MSSNHQKFHILDPKFTDPARVKKERQKARDLKQSNWWKQKLSAGVCHYCNLKFKPAELTMDHIIPIARGGESVKNNVVPACHKCNQDKKLETPVDDLFAQLEDERKKKQNESE